MPTNRDHPWIRDEVAAATRFDPADPRASAQLHLAKQQAAIDDARRATSVAPPKIEPQTSQS